MTYIPRPFDTSKTELPEEILQLAEELAKNTHEIWSQGRLQDGWKYGAVRDDKKRETPCLIPYEELSEEEKEYDRRTALETIKFLIANGYEIKRK